MTKHQIEGVTVTQADVEQATTVFRLVEHLLRELAEEGDETGTLDETALVEAWRARPDQHFVFLAHVGDCNAIGVITVVETFAIYAGGTYGVINEMYVAPDYRSTGVGERLIEAVKVMGRTRGWSRVDVAAPESARWTRTKRFYEHFGFTFTGPKLKFLIS